MYSSGSMFLCIQNRKTNSHKWEFVKVLYCIHSQIYSLSYPECLHFQQWDCFTQNPKKVSFSSSYNKTYKTYWGKMLLLSSLFINSLMHKLPKQACHQRTKNSYVQHFYTFDQIFMKNCKRYSCYSTISQDFYLGWILKWLIWR